MNIFVNNKLVFYPNGQRMIDTFIIQSGDLFDRLTINKKITISEMPSFQLLALLLEHNEVFEKSVLSLLIISAIFLKAHF